VDARSKRTVFRRVHAISGALAIVMVATFLVATLVSEAFGSHQDVTRVKRAILFGIASLVPTMAAAGLSGRRLSGRSSSPVIRRKLRRMQMIGANGLLVLIPCAIVLYRLASAGNFGALFYGFQAVEVAAGATNLVLMTLNMRDGLAMRANRSRGRRRVEPRPIHHVGFVADGSIR
jgi:hypothetical protein